MRAVALTDVGKKRTCNQDTVFCSTNPVGPLPNLFMVADGMGGENAGDYASSSLIKYMTEYIINSENSKHLMIMRSAIEKSNQELYKEAFSDKELQGMGTTLVTAVLESGILYIANVGDSRLYVIGNNISQITRDHSYVEEMVSKGMMIRGSQDYRTKKNIITRAVGITLSLNVDFFEVNINKGEIILLCTDGLTNMLEDYEIENIIKQNPEPERAANILIDEANKKGGIDNISVLLIAPSDGEVDI